MQFRSHEPADSSAIVELFVSTFTGSEGEAEGKLVGNLVKEMIAGSYGRDMCGFAAVDGEEIVGAIFFSRLVFERDIDVFILSPVAVRGDHQGRGIGQSLIDHGLREMKKRGVKIVTTYGDPAFYSRVGFRPLSRDVIPAPHELSQPEGWLGQSLDGDPIEKIPGPCSCVKALDDPAYW